MSVLDVTSLSVSFQNKNSTIEAVDGIDFYLNPAETVALVGESGCGKSLTAAALMRLLPLQARYGQNSAIHWQDTDILNISERDMRKLRGMQFGMIFQDPMTALNPVLTIGQQLAEAAGSRAKKRLASLLAEVEIPEPVRRLKQYPHQLSGGQKQRVVIAMALAGAPEVLIADEPTTALDVTTQAQLLALLKKIQKERRMRLLLITHDLSLVKAYAERIYVMYAGQMVESAAVKSFFKQPLHPYAAHLIKALPHFEKRNSALSAIPGRVPAPDDKPSGCYFHPRCAYCFETCKTEMPEIQDLSDARAVRCHLYPKHDKPPVLAEKALDHPDKPGGVGASPAATPARSGTTPAGPGATPAGPGLSGASIITVRHLDVFFPIKRAGLMREQVVHKAVHDISFDLKERHTLALVGESGSGKSTICRVLLGLQAVTHGEVLFRGDDLTRLKGRALKAFRKDVQIIFQDPYSSMNPRMTIGEILAEGMEAQHLKSQHILKRQHELLEQVNLPKTVLTRYPHQFSGGQRQRVCIARALATSPKILICDEPTSALDVSVQAQILNLLKQLQDELGLSYLFVTHNMAVVSYLADDVLVMRDGIMVEQGTCEQLLHAPKSDYTQQLLAGVLS